jgi:hypothetical protein
LLLMNKRPDLGDGWRELTYAGDSVG